MNGWIRVQRNLIATLVFINPIVPCQCVVWPVPSSLVFPQTPSAPPPPHTSVRSFVYMFSQEKFPPKKPSSDNRNFFPGTASVTKAVVPGTFLV